jgi:hypothetical protein
MTKTPKSGKPQKQKSVSVETKKSPKENRSLTCFVLSNTPVVQIISAGYATKKKKILVEENENEDLPQTLISADEDADIPVVDLLHEKSKKAYYFLDTRKIQVKYWGVMLDVTMNGALPTSTNKACWWDRHPFKTSPIGCPLVYHSHKTEGIDKERFEEKLKAANIRCDKNDFFETEGYFCSFPCCKAYILSQRNNMRYKDSASLLSLLLYVMYGIRDIIPVAPSWKNLKEYGGHLSIQEFRSSFGKLEYNETVNTRRPYMFCSSHYIKEKHLKLFRNVKD